MIKKVHTIFSQAEFINYKDILFFCRFSYLLLPSFVLFYDIYKEQAISVIIIKVEP